MGTRSLTHFQDESGATIATLYRQFDGYPEGHGADLAGLLAGRGSSNGIAVGRQGPRQPFNGAGDLAVRVVAGLKASDQVDRMDYKTGKRKRIAKPCDQPGNLYLVTPGARDCGEEWTYTVRCGQAGGVSVQVVDMGRMFAFGLGGESDATDSKAVVFDGTADEFKAWCDERTGAAEARRAARAVA